MSEIQRYRLDCAKGHSRVVPANAGDLVLYAAHVEALAAERERAGRERDEGRCIAHAAWNPDCPGCMEEQRDEAERRLAHLTDLARDLLCECEGVPGLRVSDSVTNLRAALSTAPQAAAPRIK